MPTSNIVLGIDPGIGRTGIALLETHPTTPRAITYGIIETDSQLDLPARLLELHLELKKIIQRYAPAWAGCEKLFFSNNVKTAMIVGQARGVVLLTLAQAGIPVYEFTPTQVKQSLTGYGAADKKQIQQLVKIMLNLSRIPQPDDAADALAIALAAVTVGSHPLAHHHVSNSPSSHSH